VNEIQLEIRDIEQKIQNLEDTLDAISPTNVIYPALMLELQDLREQLEPVKALAIKFNL
jgi:predicted  nucleic acid-binding Zn-ribbon protein